MTPDEVLAAMSGTDDDEGTLRERIARLDERFKERFHSFSQSQQRIEGAVNTQAIAMKSLEAAVQHNDDKAARALQDAMTVWTSKFEQTLREITSTMSTEFIRKVQFSPLERIIYVFLGGFVTLGLSLVIKRWG